MDVRASPLHTSCQCPQPLRAVSSRQRNLLWHPSPPFTAQRNSRHKATSEFRIRCNAATDAATAVRQWVKQQKFDLSKQGVRIEEHLDSLKLVSDRAAGRGDMLLIVPDSLWITPKTVAKSSIGPLVEGLAPWLQVALFLISERAADSRSPWAGYLQTLPDMPPSPLYWADAQLELLAGTQLLQSLEGYEEYFGETYAQLAQGLFAEHTGSFPADTFTADAFKWAAVIVRSRSHAPLEGDDLALVPLADLVRHSRESGVALQVDSGRFGGARALKMSAARLLPGGAPLAMDFGSDRLDNQILLDYGVLDEEVLQGGFLLTLGLPEGDRNYDDKADILDINGFGETWQFTLRAGEPPEAGLLAFLRLLNCSGPDAFLLEALFRNETWGFMLQPVSQANEDAICQSMVDGCRQALGAYPTSIDEDLELLRDEEATPAGSPTRAAIQVRLGEKEGLDSALRFFEDRAQRLNSLEYYQDRRLKQLGLIDKESGQSTWDGFFEDGMA